MATVFAHAVVAVTAAKLFGVPRQIMARAAGLAVLPDVDVLAFGLGIPYSYLFGHRGLSHSILFALAIAALVTSIGQQRGARHGHPPVAGWARVRGTGFCRSITWPAGRID